MYLQNRYSKNRKSSLEYLKAAHRQDIILIYALDKMWSNVAISVLVYRQTGVFAVQNTTKIFSHTFKIIRKFLSFLHITYTTLNAPHSYSHIRMPMFLTCSSWTRLKFAFSNICFFNYKNTSIINQSTRQNISQEHPLLFQQFLLWLWASPTLFPASLKWNSVDPLH